MWTLLGKLQQRFGDLGGSFALRLKYFLPFSLADSIQSHPSVFLEDEQPHAGPASQQSSEAKNEGGGGGDGRGRKASVTSVESGISAWSMGRLGNTIANSE